MVSTDDPQTNKEFAESLDADFPLLSDPGQEVAAAYGVLRDFGTINGRNLGTLAQRWTFYIGGDGKILKIDREVSAQTAGEDLVASLKELDVAQR